MSTAKVQKIEYVGLLSYHYLFLDAVAQEDFGICFAASQHVSQCTNVLRIRDDSVFRTVRRRPISDVVANNQHWRSVLAMFGKKTKWILALSLRIPGIELSHPQKDRSGPRAAKIES